MASTSATMGNVLATAFIVPLMESSLPEPSAEEGSLRNPYEAVALLCHTCMLAVGFRLVGLGEDHKIEARSDSEHRRPLPPEWNASSSAYAFRYVHEQSAMEYLVKVTRLGPKAVVLGMGIGDDKTNSFDVAVKDYISEASLPFRRSSEEERSERADRGQPARLQDIFISPGRVADFTALFKLRVIQKIIPGLQKEGYEESRTGGEDDGTTESSRNGGARRDRDPLRDDRFPPPAAPARPYPFEDPLVGAPRRPIPPTGDFLPPDFEDEYEILNRPRYGPAPPPPGLGGGGGGRHPLGIGHDDLYPPGLGPHDLLRSSFLPGPGLPRPGGGGGMHPTFDDPLFLGGRRDGHDDGRFDPSRPPGARYDPVGPGDEPPAGFGGPRGGRGGGFGPGGAGGGGPPNPFGGFGGGAFI